MKFDPCSLALPCHPGACRVSIDRRINDVFRYNDMWYRGADSWATGSCAHRFSYLRNSPVGRSGCGIRFGREHSLPRNDDDVHVWIFGGRINGVDVVEYLERIANFLEGPFPTCYVRAVGQRRGFASSFTRSPIYAPRGHI